MAFLTSQMIPDVFRLGVEGFYAILELFHYPKLGVGAQNSPKNFYLTNFFRISRIFSTFQGCMIAVLGAGVKNTVFLIIFIAINPVKTTL